MVEAGFRGPLWPLLGYKKTEKNKKTNREEWEYTGLSNIHPNEHWVEWPWPTDQTKKGQLNIIPKKNIYFTVTVAYLR